MDIHTKAAHFTAPLEFEGRLQGNLIWTAFHEDGKWQSCKAQYRQGGRTTHDFEFEACNKILPEKTVWKLRNVTATGDTLPLNFRILASIYRETGEWFSNLADIDPLIYRMSMIFDIVRPGTEDVIYPYVQHGLDIGYILLPQDGGQWL